jgi:hypothetical protein
MVIFITNDSFFFIHLQHEKQYINPLFISCKSTNLFIVVTAFPDKISNHNMKFSNDSTYRMFKSRSLG